MSYCEIHKGNIKASGGGTYCRFHQQELCRHINPHCSICGRSVEGEK